MAEVQNSPEVTEKAPDSTEVTRLVESIDHRLDGPITYGTEAMDLYMYEKWRAKSVEDRKHRKNPDGSLQEDAFYMMTVPDEYEGTNDPSQYVGFDGKAGGIAYYSKSVPNKLYDLTEDIELDLPRFRKELKAYTLKPLTSKDWDKWSPEEKTTYILKLKRVDLLLATGLRKDYHSLGEVLVDVKKVVPNLLDILGDEFFEELDQKYKIKINKTGFKLGIMALEFMLNGIG